MSAYIHKALVTILSVGILPVKLSLTCWRWLVVCQVSCYFKVSDLFLSLNSDDDLAGSKETIR